MKVYLGLSESKRWSHVGNVWVMEFEGEGNAMVPLQLDPRYDLRNHSPDGFAWGYGGSGPAQLALALLADAVDSKAAEKYYQAFKADVIAGMNQDLGWCLTGSDIITWLAERSKAGILELPIK